MKNAVPTNEQLKESIEERLSHLRGRLAEIDLDRATIEGEIVNLEQALKALAADLQKVKASRNGKPDQSDPVRRAGPGNVAKVEEALRDLGGTASQHQITEHAGLNNGTVSYALKALRNQQKVRRTGKRIGHSPEYQISGSTRALPGS